MSKYVVLGGFLGAGKTTSMIAFAEYLSKIGKNAAILINDLGAKNLVDSQYTEDANCCCIDTVTGGCICYQTEVLVDKLRRFRDTSKADIIFSDIPGCGIGALDHVYVKLSNEYPNEFTICPFVAVADPERLRMIMPESADINLPDEMNYLFDAQLREAEVIILNKIDMISDKQKKECMDFLAENYKDAKVFSMSAKTGEGVEEVVEYLSSNRSELPLRDIGYGGELFVNAEKRLSWYNRKAYLKSNAGKEIDANNFINELFESIRAKLQKAGRNVPHLKTFLVGSDGSSAKASLIGVDYEVVFDKKFEKPQKELKIVLNARAACESEVLDFLMDEALREVCKKYDLSCHIFFTECFGMMDEGND